MIIFKVLFTKEGFRTHQNGTGFLVAPGRILTAYHVVRPTDEDHRWRIEVRADNMAEAVSAKLAKHDPNTDWALLEVDPNELEEANPFPLRDTPLSTDEYQEEWVTWGYPDLDGASESIGGNIQSGPNNTLGTDLKLFCRQGAAANPLNPNGFSGAPVLVKGAVVGILRSKRLARNDIQGGIVNATPISQIIDQLPVGTMVGRFGSPASTQNEKLNLELVKDLKKRVVDREKHKLEIRWAFADSYQELEAGKLRGRNFKPHEFLSDDKWTEGASWDLVLLNAPGGAGKTSLMCDLAELAVAGDVHCFYLNLTAATKLLTAEVSESILFNEAGRQYRSQYDRFKHARESVLKTLVLVDGLNEVDRGVSNRILELCQGLRAPAVRILIADRMNTRSRAIDFKRTTVLPLSQKEVEAALGDRYPSPDAKDLRALLSLPFFLNLYRDLAFTYVGQEPVTRLRMFERYFESVVGIDPALKQELMAGAFRSYDIGRSLEFGFDQWSKKTSELLQASGAIQTHGKDSVGQKRYSFRHQLLHDYLVGVHVAGLRKDWGSRLFDAATFRGGSPESLSIAAEHLGVYSDSIDSFIEEVYDWNIQVVFENILELSGLPGARVSNALVLRISALYAERMFEKIKNTVEVTKHRLSRMPLAEVQALANLKTMEDLFTVVNRWPLDAKHEAWRRFFTSEVGKQATLEDIEALGGTPLMGWTASNVLRRMEIREEYQTAIRLIFRMSRKGDRQGTLRWRIVHTLGRHPSDENIALLVEAARGDEYHWVCYGAARSLMEIASIEPGARRDAILEELATILQRDSSQAHRAVQWSAAVVGADAKWYNAASELLKHGLDHAKTDGEREEWRRAIEKVRQEAAGWPS